MHVNQTHVSNWLKANFYSVEEFCVILVSLVIKHFFFENKNILHENMRACGNSELNKCGALKEVWK